MTIDPSKLSVRDTEPESQRLKLLDPLGRRRRIPGKRYTHFVRLMRLTLPLLAILIIGLLMAWPQLDKTIKTIPREEILPPSVGKNEVVSPRFQSEDSSRQPFTITADRAIQSNNDPDLVLLDRPMADITLKDGAWLAAQAQNGTYRQQSEELGLEGKVKLYHDKGYQLEMETLLVDLKTHHARCDVPVRGQGPAGELTAAGMDADNEKGVLVFTGPARLLLNRSIKGL